MDSEIYPQIPSSLLNQTLTPKTHIFSRPQFARRASSENRERWPELRRAFLGTNVMDL